MKPSLFMVIECKTMVDDELDCEVYKNEEYKNEPHVLRKSCYKLAKEEGKTIHMTCGKTYKGKSLWFRGVMGKIVYQTSILGWS